MGLRRKSAVFGGDSVFRSGAPDTIRTCDLCLRRASVHAPNPRTTHLINRKNGCCKPPGNDAHSVPPYSALRCLAKPRYGSFMTSTADRN
jgi:hypothetical protein